MSVCEGDKQRRARSSPPTEKLRHSTSPPVSRSLLQQAKPSPLKIAYLYTRYATILFGIVLFIGFFGECGWIVASNGGVRPQLR